MNQFEKRKAKSTETVAKEITDKRSEMRASKETPVATPVTEPVYNQTGYDVYTDDGG